MFTTILLSYSAASGLCIKEHVKFEHENWGASLNSGMPLPLETPLRATQQRIVVSRHAHVSTNNTSWHFYRVLFSASNVYNALERSHFMAPTPTSSRECRRRSACHRNNFVSVVSARILTRMSMTAPWNSSLTRLLRYCKGTTACQLFVGKKFQLPQNCAVIFYRSHCFLLVIW